MQQTGSFIEYLVDNSRKGNKNSYLELCGFYLKRVYQLIYQINANKAVAEELTADTFLKAWHYVPKLQKDINFDDWIMEIAALISHFKLKEAESLSDTDVTSELAGDQSGLSGFEKTFNELGNIEKIVITLYTKLNFPLSKITRFFKDISELTIIDRLVDSISKFVAEDDEIIIGKEQIKLIINAEQRGDIQLSGANEKVTEKYNSIKNKLSKIFSDAETNEPIIDIVKEKLIEESQSEKERKRKKISKEEKQKKSLKEQLDAEREFALSQTTILAPDKVEQLIAKSDKREAKKLFKKISIGFGTLVTIIVLVIGLVHLSKFNTPWIINPEYGIYSVNGANNVNEINENELIKTYESSQVAITIPNTGSIRLGQNSLLKLIKGFDPENIVNLENGSLEYSSKRKMAGVETLNGEANFIVSSKAGTISTEIAAFKFSVGSVNLLTVDEGWVKFKNNNRDLFIGSGYVFEIDIPGAIPFHKSAADIIKQTCRRPELLSTNLITILNAAEDTDVLSLWYMFLISDRNEKQFIIEKIDEFIPEVTSELGDNLTVLEQQADFILNTINWILYSTI